MPQEVPVRERSGADPVRVAGGRSPRADVGTGTDPNSQSAASAGRQRPGVQLRRAVTLLAISLLVPGSAQLAAGNRRVGLIAVRIWAGALALLGLTGLLWLAGRGLLLRLATSPAVLTTLAVVCFVAAFAVAALAVDAWRLGRPHLLPLRARRWLAAAMVAVVVLAGYPLVAVGRRAMAAADLIGSVFVGQRASAAAGGRYNVLLLGGDAGPDRIGTRPDSVTLASIDANTGRTVLFSLPRNLENVPFAPGSAAAKANPKGFSCGDQCLLNAVYTWGGKHAALFPGAADPGAEAMKQAAEGITGLKVNYYVLIDLQGFRQLIDAFGGIRITVQTRVPIGGGTSKVSGYLEPGTQTLNGYRALWFARSRHGGSDYERMARQRCVMDAMLRQLDPGTVLERFQAIAAASTQVVSTDLPSGELPTFLQLATRAKERQVTSVQFVPPTFRPAYPDYELIHATVRTSIADATSTADAPRAAARSTAGATPGGPAAATAAVTGATSPATAPVTTPSAGGTSSAGGTAVGGPAVDVSAVCSPAG